MSEEQVPASAAASRSHDPNGSSEMATGKRGNEEEGESGPRRKRGRLQNVHRRALPALEFCDDITHRRLQNKQVIAARKKEAEYIHRHRLYSTVSKSEADGYETVDTK